MNAPLNIGLIGAGRMGRSHAGQIALNANTRLCGIADPMSATLAQELNVPHYVDYADLLAAKPDAVIIATPNDQHVATALDCINSGCPVLLEKPVGLTLEEVATLAHRIEHIGVPVLVGHHRRHHPVFQAAHAAIASGRLGELVTVNGLWLTKKPDAYFDSWRRSAGAGVMLINLVHDLDIFRYLVGELESVQAVVSHRSRNFEVEDTASLLLKFENGVIGTLAGSDTVAAPWGWDQNSGDDLQYAQHPDQSCYALSGTRASLSIPQLNLWSYDGPADWHHRLSMDEIHRPAGGALERQLQHFVDLIRHGVDPLVSVADAAGSLAAVNAVHQAAETGTAVKVQSLTAKPA